MPKAFLRKKALKLLLLFFITILIPTLITLISNGKKEYKVYSSSKSGKNIIIDNGITTETMDVEEFLPCTVLAQLPPDSNEELLKSFIVIMRTYILSCMDNENSIPLEKLDIPYISYSELELEYSDNFPDIYNKINKLVCDTSLKTISYNNALISPYYHSGNCGKTRSGAEVLGEGYDYLPQVTCQYDTEIPNYTNTFEYDYNEYCKLLADANSAIVADVTSPLETTQIVQRDSSGYILSISINGSIIDINQFCDAFSLPSSNFTLEDANGTVKITTYGNGHGLGVSLNHAKKMAENGSTYLEILNYFYNGVSIN